MDTHLVYGQEPTLEATDETSSIAGLRWCGMLCQEDKNGISLSPLMQYQFEPAELDQQILKEAEKLNVLFIWQKFIMHDMEFKRLLFVDYDTGVERMDYPKLEGNQGVYYEVGEVLPYTAFAPHTHKKVFFNDGATRSQPIQEVMLDMNAPKYANQEFKNLFFKIISPYREWVTEETRQYHDSLFHKSYTHELFDSYAEWQAQVNSWLLSMSNEDTIANSQAQYKAFLKRQTDRVVDELTRTVSQPKDTQTIDGFIKQINFTVVLVNDLHNKNRSVKKINRISQIAMPENYKYNYDVILGKIDKIIFDVDFSDSVENKLVLQELFSFISHISKKAPDSQESNDMLRFAILEWLPLTEFQNFMTCKMCCYYFRGLLEDKLLNKNETSVLDSYELNLIEFAAYVFVINFSSMLASAQ